MKKILLLSRHDLLPKQVEVLKEKIGEFEIIKENKTYKNSKELINHIEQIKPDYIIPILPLPLIIDLFNYIKENGKPFVILRPEMELLERFFDKPIEGDDIVCMRMVENGEVKYRAYKFKYWKVLKKIEIVEEPL